MLTYALLALGSICATVGFFMSITGFRRSKHHQDRWLVIMGVNVVSYAVINGIMIWGIFT